MKDLPFIHLRTQSSYSLSESAIKIEKLVNLAKESNMPAVALTDNNNLFGALEFSLKCKSSGIQPIIGTSVNLFSIDEIEKKFNNQITILAKNEIGYKNLLILSSNSHIHSKDNIPGLTINQIINNKEGLIVFFGGIYNPILNYFKLNKSKKANEFLKKLKNIFNEDLFMELQRIDVDELDYYEQHLINISLDLDIPLIASNNVQYPKENYFDAHDSLICIAEQTKIFQENRKKSNPNIYFKDSNQMKELFKDIPEVIENTFYISLKCNYSPSNIEPQLPKYISKDFLSESDELIQISKKGLENKINIHNLVKDKDIYFSRINYELDIINKMGFAGYFLIVSDFINWAKNQKIPVGPGRGSGAGSVVAWSLNITDLDPLKYGLIFERFLNPERKSLPDFDIDFCRSRRDEVIEYVSQKYGKNSVAHIITFGTLASRAVVRDLGRVHGIPYSEVDSFSKMIPYNPSNPITLSKSIELEPAMKKIINEDERIKLVVDQGLKLEGLYRHASTHAAGVVISDKSLDNIIPLYKDPKTQKINTQFSMDYVEKSGLIKFDFLGLTTLTIIDQAIKLIKKNNNKFDINQIPLNDKKTFEMLSSGLTTGIFQLESTGMKDVLRRLKPDRFEDIIAVVALFRPGPMDNITSFCNRKHGIEKIDYFHPLLEPALKETYGIIVYQEQVMQIAQILSGYSLGEADILRKAMGKKIAKEMKAQKSKFIDGAIKKGLNNQLSSYIFDLIDKFAGYGFNKCHAVGYALIAYQTAYLKAHFPEEFLVSSMNLSINNTENIVMFKKEINDLNIEFLKPDINFSQTNFSIEINNNKKAIRFGLAAIKGVGYASMENLILERNSNGKFTNIIDFVSRLKNDVVNKRQLEKLILSGSFDSIELNRAFIFINVQNLINISNNLKNNDQSSLFNDKDVKLEYQKNLLKNENWKIPYQLKQELDVIGFYFSNHPLNSYSEGILKIIGVSSYDELIKSKTITKAKIVGSILDIKERTSKDGNKYAFVTISDKYNQYDLTIFGDNFRRFFNIISEGNTLIFDIDIQHNNQNNIRFIIKDASFLEEKLKSLSFIHHIYLNNLKDAELIKDHIKKTQNNQNKLFLYLDKENSKICISFDNNSTFIDQEKFDNLLKNHNILRTISLSN